MGNEWIESELRKADFNDKRLNERFAEVLQNLSQHPNVSIPAACSDYAEIMSSYRFFSNKKVTKEAILQPHRHATKDRITCQDVVLCVQDTTELDLNRPQQQIRGLGPIGTTSNRRGGYLH